MEDEQALGAAFAALGAKPEYSADELRKWIVEMGKQLEAPGSGTGVDQKPVVPAALNHFPRLPVFSGEKGETSFLQWKSEVLCVKQEEQVGVVMQAVRRSLRGNAADVLLHLGDSVTLDQLLEKMEVVFGEVLSAEQLLEGFYSAKQKANESVATWGCRLEELVDKARRKGAIEGSAVEAMLRTKFWSGLASPEVKMALRHLFDQKVTFNKLLGQARADEAELSTKVAVVRSQQTDAVGIKLDLIIQRLSALESRLGKVEEGQKERGQTPAMERPRVCYSCGDPGHFANKCPWKKGNGKGAVQGGDGTSSSGNLPVPR